MIHKEGGVAIAAHIDRQAFGVIGQLGFIPPKVKFDALEVTFRVPLGAAKSRFPEYSQYCFITNSDAHYLNDIGKSFTQFRVAEPSFSAIARALRNIDSCSVAPAG